MYHDSLCFEYVFINPGTDQVHVNICKALSIGLYFQVPQIVRGVVGLLNQLSCALTGRQWLVSALHFCLFSLYRSLLLRLESSGRFRVR